MKKKTFFILLMMVGTFLFLLMSQNSHATLLINHVGGDIYTEVNTTLNGDSSSNAYDVTGHVVNIDTTDAAGNNATANANSTVSQGSMGESSILFNLITTAINSCATPPNGTDFVTTSTARSGPNLGDMLQLEISSNGDEAFLSPGELSARSFLSGVLQSGGASYFVPGSPMGIASIDFHFSVYAQDVMTIGLEAAPDLASGPILHFDYSESFEGTGSSTLETFDLPGYLVADGYAPEADNLYSTSCWVGEILFVDFSQTVTINVSGGLMESAQGFGVYSDNEIMTLVASASDGGIIDPDPDPVPEPASFLLLGFGLLGVGIIKRKKGTI